LDANVSYGFRSVLTLGLKRSDKPVRLRRTGRRTGGVPFGHARPTRVAASRTLSGPITARGRRSEEGYLDLRHGDRHSRYGSLDSREVGAVSRGVSFFSPHGSGESPDIYPGARQVHADSSQGYRHPPHATGSWGDVRVNRGGSLSNRGASLRTRDVSPKIRAASPSIHVRLSSITDNLASQLLFTEAATLGRLSGRPTTNLPTRRGTHRASPLAMYGTCWLVVGSQWIGSCWLRTRQRHLAA
jgi:hypothetical protein